MDTFPGAIVAPRAEVGPDRGPRRKVMRQSAPLTPRAVHVQERIEQCAHVYCARTPPWLSWWDERRKDRPLLVGEAALVSLGEQLFVRSSRGELLLPALPHE